VLIYVPTYISMSYLRAYPHAYHAYWCYLRASPYVPPCTPTRVPINVPCLPTRTKNSTREKENI